MGSEIIKIIKFIITTGKLSNYIYKPTGDRLSIITTSDLLRNENMNFLLKSRAVTNYTNGLEIIGTANPSAVEGFLNLFEGREVVKILLENSSYIDTIDNDSQENREMMKENFIMDLKEIVSEMSVNDVFASNNLKQ